MERHQALAPGTLDRAMYGYREALRSTWNLVVRYGRDPGEYAHDLRVVLFDAIVASDMEKPGNAGARQDGPFDSIAVSFRGGGIIRRRPGKRRNAWEDYLRGTVVALQREQTRFVAIFDFDGSDDALREYEFAEVIVIDAGHELHGWRVLLPFRDCHFWDLSFSAPDK